MTKQARLNVRLSEQQLTTIKDRASSNNKTVSDYILGKCLPREKCPKHKPLEESVLGPMFIQNSEGNYHYNEGW